MLKFVLAQVAIHYFYKRKWNQKEKKPVKAQVKKNCRLKNSTSTNKLNTLVFKRVMTDLTDKT